jgi:hypothetical protein
MKFDLTIEDFTILQNAVHYYKHVEKRGDFKRFDVKRCEELRDKLSQQLVHEQTFTCPDCGTDCRSCSAS